MSKGLKIFVIILIVLMLGAGGLYAYKIYKDKYDVIEENVVAGENILIKYLAFSFASFSAFVSGTPFSKSTFFNFSLHLL